MKKQNIKNNLKALSLGAASLVGASNADATMYYGFEVNNAYSESITNSADAESKTNLYDGLLSMESIPASGYLISLVTLGNRTKLPNLPRSHARILQTTGVRDHSGSSMLGNILASDPVESSSISYDFNGINAAIPDGNRNGHVDSRTLSDVQGSSIDNLVVRLNISGGFNGDLYGYLRHETPQGTGFAVLVNQVGKDGILSLGYSDPGFNIRLVDVNTVSDIHTYQAGTYTLNTSGQLTGDWRVDQSGGANGFSSFYGLDANGRWDLFLADLTGGDQSTLVSWGIELTTTPEPATTALGIFGAVFAAFRAVKAVRKKPKK